MELLLENIDNQAKEFLKLYKEKRVFAFEGNLGAGKTTFIKALCKALGVADKTSSPSFGIVNEYKTNSNDTVFHMDFYRMNNANEIQENGIEEILESGHYCFIEWPQIAKNVLPPETVTFVIERLENKRYLRQL